MLCVLGTRRGDAAMKLLQIWKFAGDARDASNLDDAIATAKRYGFDGLLVKALDGTDWMRTYDAADDALASAAHVASQRERCQAAQLKYYVWTNPLHDVDLDRQAALTAEAALAADGLFLDSEPYASFWGAWRPQGSAERFMQGIRQRAPRAWLALQPDPRPARLAELRPEEWLPYVDAFAGQHYWTDFFPDRAGWASRARLELANAAELGQQWGKPVLPTLPGISDPSVVPVDLLRDFSGFVVYRLGTTRPAMLELLGGVRYEAAAPLTQPPQPLDPFEPLVNALAYVCDTLGDQLATEADRLTSEAESIRNVVGELQRVRTQFIGARPSRTELPAPVPVAEPTPTPTPTPIPRPRFDPNTPTLTQPNDWACSVFSSTMALQSMGIKKTWLDVRAELGDAVTEQFGLMDAAGSALVRLFRRHGFMSDVTPWTSNASAGATWEDVQRRAGRMPLLLGGRRWYHWTFVRGVDANGNLLLGNPAPRWKLVGQSMDREEFDRWGAWTMVWLDASDALLEEEDPVRIAQLEQQIAQLQVQIADANQRIEGLATGLAHVVDVIVPELANPQTSAPRRLELKALASSVRVQFLGEPAAPA
jgi:hypothetical protein